MKSPAKHSQRNDVLSYCIDEQVLYGTVGTRSFSMKAFSGGGRGSTAGMAQNTAESWDTQVKANKSRRGGPLPEGWYIVLYVKKHKKYGECAALKQTLLSLLYTDDKTGDLKVTERNDFMIHRRGPRGSDGCIVPEAQSSLNSLLTALRTVKHPIVLEVFRN